LSYRHNEIIFWKASQPGRPVLPGWSEESAEMGDSLCRGLVCEMEGDSPVDCPIQCHAMRRLCFNSEIELVHRKPSAKSISLSLLNFNVYSLCKVACEILICKGMSRHRFRRW
jgi:hypothetical protein